MRIYRKPTLATWMTLTAFCALDARLSPGFSSSSADIEAQVIRGMAHGVFLLVLLAAGMLFRRLWLIFCVGSALRYSIVALYLFLFHGMYTWSSSLWYWEAVRDVQWCLDKYLIATDLSYSGLSATYLDTPNLWRHAFKWAVRLPAISFVYGLVALWLASTCYDVKRQAVPEPFWRVWFRRVRDSSVRLPGVWTWMLALSLAGYTWTALHVWAYALQWYVAANRSTFLIGSAGLIMLGLVIACRVKRVAHVVLGCFALRLGLNMVDIAVTAAYSTTPVSLARFVGLDFVRRLTALECTLSAVAARHWLTGLDDDLHWLRCAIALSISGLFAAAGFAFARISRPVPR